MCAFSGKDQMLPSAEEAKRLRKILPNCITRYFKDSGHTLFLVRLLPSFIFLKSQTNDFLDLIGFAVKLDYFRNFYTTL